MRWKKGEVSVLLSHFTSPYIQQKYSYLSCVTSWLPGAIMGPGPFPLPPNPAAALGPHLLLHKTRGFEGVFWTCGIYLPEEKCHRLAAGRDWAESQLQPSSQQVWLRTAPFLCAAEETQCSHGRSKSRGFWQEKKVLPGEGWPAFPSENTHLLSWGSIKALKEGSFSQGLPVTGHDSS